MNFKKIYKDCPKMAKFGPFFKFFVSVPPFLIGLNPFLAKKNSIRLSAIRKILKIGPNLVILGQFSYITNSSYRANFGLARLKSKLLTISKSGGHDKLKMV